MFSLCLHRNIIVDFTASAVRCFSTTHKLEMPYNPEDRPPMSEREKRLYPQVEQEFTDEGYPVLKIFPRPRSLTRESYKKERRVYSTGPQRIDRMTPDIDWPSFWTTAKSFHPSAVPLPLHQSYESELKSKIPRGKYANTELQKVPNFLHLTPIAVARQCEALKKFCTKWPDALKTDEECRKHFPVTYVKTDYVFSSPNIREPRARIVDLKVHIDDLHLDDHAKDKIKRLCIHRYDPETEKITITASACPYRNQNQDYADYLLTAVYYESVKYEQWEDEKPDYDW